MTESLQRKQKASAESKMMAEETAREPPSATTTVASSLPNGNLASGGTNTQSSSNNNKNGKSLKKGSSNTTSKKKKKKESSPLASPASSSSSPSSSKSRRRSSSNGSTGNNNNTIQKSTPKTERSTSSSGTMGTAATTTTSSPSSLASNTSQNTSKSTASRNKTPVDMDTAQLLALGAQTPQQHSKRASAAAREQPKTPLASTGETPQDMQRLSLATSPDASTITTAASTQQGKGTATSKMKPPPSSSGTPGIVHQVDRFGFILNMDKQGHIVSAIPTPQHQEQGARKSKVQGPPNLMTLTPSEAKRWERRETKWKALLGVGDFENTRKRRHKLVTKRVRKGVPLGIRGKVWAAVARAQVKPNVYQELVRQTVVDPLSDVNSQDGASTNGLASPSTTNTEHDNDGNSKYTSIQALGHTKSFRNVQETIERDIHRTFPRHNLFYEDDEDDTETGNGEEDADWGSLCNPASAVTDLLVEGSTALQGNQMVPETASAEWILNSKGGQASLRRVLKAYSAYDREIGYCQGMNFIAGMFITLMPEEDAFWLLVAVMQKAPCHMRDLFGEGMSATHKVLYVAEKLIHQFLPKLAKHFDREHIHITMFATQWLLTQFTSSFRFDLVLRVWDCFLYEGWKITYRVMLSILLQAQPTLLRMSFEDILAYFRELPDRLDGAAVVEASYKIPLKKSHLIKYEKEWEAAQRK